MRYQIDTQVMILEVFSSSVVGIVEAFVAWRDI